MTILNMSLWLYNEYLYDYVCLKWLYTEYECIPFYWLSYWKRQYDYVYPIRQTMTKYCRLSDKNGFKELWLYRASFRNISLFSFCPKNTQVLSLLTGNGWNRRTYVFYSWKRKKNIWNPRIDFFLERETGNCYQFSIIEISLYSLYKHVTRNQRMCSGFGKRNQGMVSNFAISACLSKWPVLERKFSHFSLENEVYF